MFSRILILAPHIDDGEFGCGGSISRWAGEGKDVYYVAFSSVKKIGAGVVLEAPI